MSSRSTSCTTGTGSTASAAFTSSNAWCRWKTPPVLKEIVRQDRALRPRLAARGHQADGRGPRRHAELPDGGLYAGHRLPGPRQGRDADRRARSDDGRGRRPALSRQGRAGDRRPDQGDVSRVGGLGGRGRQGRPGRACSSPTSCAGFSFGRRANDADLDHSRRHLLDGARLRPPNGRNRRHACSSPGRDMDDLKALAADLDGARRGRGGGASTSTPRDPATFAPDRQEVLGGADGAVNAAVFVGSMPSQAEIDADPAPDRRRGAPTISPAPPGSCTSSPR